MICVPAPRRSITSAALAVGAAFCLFVGVAAAQPAPKSTVNLKPVWKEGQTARYRSTTQRQIHRTVIGQDVEQKRNMLFEAEVTWKVLKADEEGGGRVEMSIDDVKMQIAEGDGKTYSATPDRADEQLAAAQPLLEGLTSRPIRLTVGPDGAVERIEGWKSLANAAGEAGRGLTESDFRELAFEVALLPGGLAEAAAGASWQEQFDWSHEMGQLELDTRYKLLALERIAGVPVANIQAVSDVDFEIDREKFGGQSEDGPEVDVKFKGGEQAAQIMYDLSRQEIVGQNISRRLQFQINLSYQGRSFKQSLTHATITQVIRLEED